MGTLGQLLRVCSSAGQRISGAFEFPEGQIMHESADRLWLTLGLNML